MPHGFLVKDSAHAELIDAIRSVAAGKPTFSPAIERQLKSAGPDCVKAHLKAAFARLGATSRSEAVAIAIRLRLLEG